MANALKTKKAKTDKISYLNTITFDDSLVPTFDKQSIKFHLLFCQDELSSIKEKIKSVDKESDIAKAMRGWRQRMYNRVSLLKKFE